jgi:hypothetical protein
MEMGKIRRAGEAENSEEGGGGQGIKRGREKERVTVSILGRSAASDRKHEVGLVSGDLWQ